jgi:hypothetical protein
MPITEEAPEEDGLRTEKYKIFINQSGTLYLITKGVLTGRSI